MPSPVKRLDPHARRTSYFLTPSLLKRVKSEAFALGFETTSECVEVAITEYLDRRRRRRPRSPAAS